MQRLENTEFGTVTIHSLPFPEFVTNAYHPMYLSSGRVLFGYTLPDEAQDYYHIATINDDGSDFLEIFEGEIPQHKTANGLRMMPYRDNKRVLLGDYVLEASPDLDTATQSQLVPIRYPKHLVEREDVMCHWSEIVIAPDNLHMAWTALYDIGAINFLGKLQRTPTEYVLEDIQVISSTDGLREDPENPGQLLPAVMRGGEIKQFIRGGTALSLVGSTGTPLPNSVIQDLQSEELVAITQAPGYEETTILSPDEQLGIAMSTRNSPHTNFGILGLLPRPYGGLVVSNLNFCVYMYAVAKVRSSVKGNVGPVLLSVQHSIEDKNYQGVALHDPEEQWVYHSPMSWHPGGTKAMWPETLRGTQKNRVQIVTLEDYQPGTPVPAGEVPRHIPYATSLPEELTVTPPPTSGIFQGKHSGQMEYTGSEYSLMTQSEGETKTVYENYSDDGKTFYNGYEMVKTLPGQGLLYEAKLAMEGEEQGEMNLRLSFLYQLNTQPTLQFDLAADGQPKSMVPPFWWRTSYRSRVVHWTSIRVSIRQANRNSNSKKREPSRVMREGSFFFVGGRFFWVFITRKDDIFLQNAPASSEVKIPFRRY